VTMDQTHFNIVILQREYYPTLDFDVPPPLTCSTTFYPNTTPDLLRERIRDAHIVVASYMPFTAETLSPEVTPNLRMIAMIAVGTDLVNLDACRKRGIIVSNCPNANVESVSEHAIGLYFAARRSVVLMHSLTCSGEWMRQSTLMGHMLNREKQPPLTCTDEVVGIVGYGAVGRLNDNFHIRKLRFFTLRKLISSQVKELQHWPEPWE
jgi:phosphoglycerate dehydrogenase-like enzyme